MIFCGIVGYIVFEIVKDERYSKSVDMWVFGCVLYIFLCGFFCEYFQIVMIDIN